MMLLLLLLCAITYFLIQNTLIYSILLSIIGNMPVQGRLVTALAIPTLLCMEVAC